MRIVSDAAHSAGRRDNQRRAHGQLAAVAAVSIEGGRVKRYEVFIVAVLANIVGAVLYDYMKRKASEARL